MEDALNLERLSRDVACAAISLAMTESREEEARLREMLAARDIASAAADYGGAFDQSVMKIVERAIIAARRENIIGPSHHEEGVVAGAAREAVSQGAPKALGLPVGGKIAVARTGEHVAVAVFFNIGLMHLDEVCIGLGHRSI